MSLDVTANGCPWHSAGSVVYNPESGTWECLACWQDDRDEARHGPEK